MFSQWPSFPFWLSSAFLSELNRCLVHADIKTQCHVFWRWPKAEWCSGANTWNTEANENAAQSDADSGWDCFCRHRHVSGRDAVRAKIQVCMKLPEVVSFVSRSSKQGMRKNVCATTISDKVPCRNAPCRNVMFFSLHTLKGLVLSYSTSSWTSIAGVRSLKKTASVVSKVKSNIIVALVFCPYAGFNNTQNASVCR